MAVGSWRLAGGSKDPGIFGPLDLLSRGQKQRTLVVGYQRLTAETPVRMGAKKKSYRKARLFDIIP